MIINNIFLFSNNIIFLWIIIYILIIIINYKNILIKRTYGSVEDLKKDRLLAQIYLDQFFITNKFYTILISSIYIFSIIIIFIIIRYMYMYDITKIMPQDNIYERILQIIFVYILVGITIILYRSLVIILCKKEVNKLCIYLQQYIWLYKLLKLLEFSLGKYIFGHLYVITHRLGTLTYKYPYYPSAGNVQDWHNANIKYLFDDEVDYEIQMKYLVFYVYKIQDISSQYSLAQKAFIRVAPIFRFLFKHIHRLYQPLPYFIIICVFIIELYNKEFIYINIALFLLLIIKTKRDLYLFLHNRRDYKLYKYFYANSPRYEEQRVYFYKKENINIIPWFHSIQNETLFRNLNEVIEYTYNKNFLQEWDLISKKEKGIYRRFWLIIGFIMIIYYILFHYNIYIEHGYLLLLFTPMIIMIYAHYYTYCRPINFTNSIFIEFEMIDYEYSKKNNIIFWIIAIIQGYIFWLLLLKPELIIMDTEVLLELPYNILKIVKIYTVEEKIMYLYNYFEYYISTLKYIDKDYIRYIVRKIDYNDLINESITLKDIQVYIKILIDNYHYNEYFQVRIKEFMVEELYKEENPWYTLCKNIIIIGAVMFTLMYYNNVYIVIKQIQSPGGIKILMKDIYTKTLENKLTYDTLINYIMKIFKW